MMTFVIAISVLSLLLCIRSSMDRLSKRVLSFYLFFWFAALCLSISGFQGLHTPHISTIFILLGHLLTFVLGFSVVKVERYSHDIRKEMPLFDIQINTVVSSKKFIIVLIISLVYVSSMFAIFFKEVMVADALVDVRKDFYSGEMLGSGFSFINTYFLIPFHGFLLSVFGYLTFYKRNVVWVLSGVHIIMYSLLSAGRNEFVNIILIIVFFAICIGRYASSNQRKNYIVFAFLIIFIYSIMGFLTGNRSGLSRGNSLSDGMEETNTHIIAYLGGPVVAFDYALNSNIINECGGYQYGAMTFASIDEVEFMGEAILRKVAGGIPRERAISKIGSYLRDNYIDVGTPWRWNALYTSCIYYYLDFGILGVLLLPFIFGAIVRYLIRCTYRYKSVFFIILIAFVFYILVNTFQRFFLYRMSQLLLLFVLYHYGKKYVINKNI